jgi:hypothetical protein
MNTIFMGESPALVASTAGAVIARSLARTYLLRGADTPGLHIPIQQSFGGEGTSYQQHLLPTIALVAGPWTLYNPAFGMEAIDFQQMRRQTLVFSDLIQQLSGVATPLLGGGYVVQRAARGLICASAFSKLGFTRCPGDPYE